MSGWDPPVFVEYPPGYQYRGGQTSGIFLSFVLTDNKLEINLNMPFPSSNDSNFQNEA